MRLASKIMAVVVMGVLNCPAPVLACAACYGKSDSALAEGMNWGVFTLLIVVAGVLGSVASFFVYLAKRSAALGSASGQPAGSAEIK